jgi:HNH endonuclease
VAGDAVSPAKADTGVQPWRRRLCPIAARRVPVADRFWSKVRKSDACWEWTAARHPFGYGLLQIEGRSIGAHRVSYALHYGLVPDGIFVLHRCDNPACVRPDHLFLGTHADNMRDKTEKGRNNAPSGDRAPVRLHPEIVRRGDNHPQARLTWEEVRLIKTLYATGGYTHRALSDRFGVSRTSVTHIINGKTWKGHHDG